MQEFEDGEKGVQGTLYAELFSLLTLLIPLAHPSIPLPPHLICRSVKYSWEVVWPGTRMAEGGAATFHPDEQIAPH
jgi:hypothetical protein